VKNNLLHTGEPVRLSVDFSAETLQARKELDNTVNVLKGKLPTKNILPSKFIHQN